MAKSQTDVVAEMMEEQSTVPGESSDQPVSTSNSDSGGLLSKFNPFNIKGKVSSKVSTVTNTAGQVFQTIAGKVGLGGSSGNEDDSGVGAGTSDSETDDNGSNIGIRDTTNDDEDSGAAATSHISTSAHGIICTLALFVLHQIINP
jgi:hypothetical protein